MDETSICVFQCCGKGNVFLSKGHQARQNASAGDRRKYLTRVAFICDDMAIQKFLPEVLIANEHTLSDGELAALRRLCPPHVRILRRRSAWVDAEITAVILGWLADALAPYVRGVQPILILDAHRVHHSPMVIETSVRRRLWLIVAPARLTWLLQPLDTHAFFPYKVHLHHAYQLARTQSVDGTAGLVGLVTSVLAAIREVLERTSWAHAFDHNGFGGNQLSVSTRVTSWLQIDAPVYVPSSRPSLDQLRLSFPRCARVAVLNILRPIDATLRDRRSLHLGDAPASSTTSTPPASSSSSGFGAAPRGQPMFHRPMRWLDSVVFDS